MSHRLELKNIAYMVWPAAFSSIAFSIVELIDTTMMGMVGLDAMAGGILASTILYLVLAFPLSMFRAMTPLAASLEGTDLHHKVQALFRLALCCVIPIGIFLAALVSAIALVLPQLGYQEGLVAYAKTYLLWRAPFVPVELAFFAGWAILEGLTNTRVPLKASLACNVANVFLNLILIPNWGGKGLGLGIVGAAIATNISMLIGLIGIVFSTHRVIAKANNPKDVPSKIFSKPQILQQTNSDYRNKTDSERIFLFRWFARLGWPLGLSGLLDVAGWLIIGLIIPRIGPVATATHGIVSQLITFGLAIANGGAVTATILVARAEGEGRRFSSKNKAKATLLFQVVAGIISIPMVCWLGGIWISLFLSDSQIHSLAYDLLPWCAGIIWCEGLTVVIGGVLEGLGRTRVILLSTAIFDIAIGLSAIGVLMPYHNLRYFYGIWLLKNILKFFFLWRIVFREFWHDVSWITLRGKILYWVVTVINGSASSLVQFLVTTHRNNLSSALNNSRWSGWNGKSDILHSLQRWQLNTSTCWWLIPLPDG